MRAAWKARKPFFGPVAEQLRGWDVPATVACIVTCTVLIVGHYQGGVGSFGSFFPRVTSGRFSDLYGFFWWYGASFVLFLLAPLVAAALTPGIRVRELGVGFGDWRFGLGASALLLGIMLPIVVVAAFSGEFANHYPLAPGAARSTTHLALYEITYAIYFISWEFLYRGYLLFSLERRVGNLAIVLQAVPFALLHLGKPEAETLGSILAGLALGVVALRARSFWYGAIVHVAVAATMDLCLVVPKLLH